MEDLEHNQVQIIDDNGEFTDVMDRIVKEWNFASRGFDYKVIAILGCQSSGKSMKDNNYRKQERVSQELLSIGTLLNLLFGTRFAVMDKSRGRQQTTQGIWLSRSQHSDILVFDVEGTDSKERGDSSISFERKTSLFSLALSEILLINMWVHDIGRLQASNLSLLKVVLELNLQLFQKRKSSKTLLLFVLRDWDGDVELPVLESQLNQDLKNIWNELQKPEEFKNSKIEDFFEFSHIALPHKVYNGKRFEEEAINLRNRLVDSNNSQYLWKREYKTDIPADGFPIYIRNIWEVIKHNKDLDLPSQKEMMAIYRCDEISNEVYTVFCEELSPLSNVLRSGEIVEDFGEKTSLILGTAIQNYNEPASRYHKEVATKKGEELTTKMKKDLFALFVDLVSKFRVSSISKFENLVKENITDDTMILDNFSDIMTKLKRDVIQHFVNSSSGGVPEQCKGEWDFQSDLENLEKLINKDINSIRENQIMRFIEQLKKSMKLIAIEPLEDLLDQAGPKMWPQIRELYQSAIEKIVIRLEKKLIEFDCPKDDASKYVKSTNDNLTQLFISAVTARAKGLHNELLKRFESVFKYDERGMPRKWEKGVDIPEIFQRAKDAALPLIDVFAIIQLDANIDYSDYENIPPEFILNSKRECAQMATTFSQAAESMFTSARSEQDKNSVSTQIPTYFVILFILFAFDDLWPWISSPIFFPLILFFGLAAGVIWYLGMTPLVLTVAKTTVNQAYNQYGHHLPAIVRPAGNAPENKIKNE